MGIKNWLNRIDRIIILFMKTYGHFFERFLIGLIFIWIGSLKVLEYATATSLIAKSVYWFDPGLTVPVLGCWEVFMGFCLMIKPLIRFSILLLIIRFMGTLLAFYYHFDLCFEANLLIPTIQGQYLLKELTLLGAAMVIAGTVRKDLHFKPFHFSKN